jgi:hypothetical protein
MAQRSLFLGAASMQALPSTMLTQANGSRHEINTFEEKPRTNQTVEEEVGDMPIGQIS